MARKFVSEGIDAAGGFDPETMSRGEPSLPPEFRWRDRTLVVQRVVRTWRSTKVDRGDAYLARHWYEVDLQAGERAVIYFDRRAQRGPRWWLYTIDDLS